MGYRRLLLTRWSRRDWLAVGVVALTTIFLVGSALTLTAASTQVTAQTIQFDTDATATYVDGSATTPSGGTLALPVATATVDGNQVLVVGIPSGTPETLPSASLPWAPARLPPPPAEGRAFGPVAATTTATLRGEAGRATREVDPHPEASILRAGWYVADVATVERLGRTGTLVVDPGGENPDRAVPRRGTLVLPVVPFLLTGMETFVATLWYVTAGGAVLVAGTLYSVTRMTVRDRARTVFVARASGASRATVVGLFAARAVLIAVVGATLGYALGVVVVNGVVNVGVALGVPTTLSPTVDASAARRLGPMLVTFVGVGGVAGVVATWRAVSGPPTALLENDAPDAATASVLPGRLGRLLDPGLLRWRALAPTTVSLAVFATIVLLIASVGGTLAPLTAPGTGTITDPSSPHPLASRVDADTAATLRAQGTPASPEIILPQVVDGQPYVARGADYGSFATVSNASLTAGRSPRTAREAVVGSDLATTLDVGVGDTLLLGGGVAPGVARVTVVGQYRAPGLNDDQLVVPLATARNLSGLRDDEAMLIRTVGFDASASAGGSSGGTADETSPSTNASTDSSIIATGLSAPARAPVDDAVSIRVDVHNYGVDRAERVVTVALGNATATRTVTLGGGASTTVTFTVSPRSTGRYVASVDGYAQPIEVVPATSLAVRGVPARAPPNATLLLTVTNATGAPVSGATVSVANRSSRENATGTARIRLPAQPGAYQVLARSNGTTSAPRTFTVADDAERSLLAVARVRPASVTVGRRATADLSLHNPWTRPLTREVRVVDGQRTVWNATVTVDAGAERTTTVRLPRATDPGERTVTVRAKERDLATASYRVVGDERLESALARSGRYSAGSPLGTGIEQLFGNFQLLQVLLVVLASVMVIGSTAMGFAWAVQARREIIGIERATGATPTQVLRQLVVDGLRIGIVATVQAIGIALVALLALDAAGALTFFGIRVAAVPSVGTLALTAGAAIALAVVSVAVASAGLLLAPPGRLLSPRSQVWTPQRGGETRD